MLCGRVGNVNLAKHRINLIPEAKPVYQLPRGAEPDACEFEREEVQGMVNKGDLEPHNSKWTLVVVYDKKKWLHKVLYQFGNEVPVRDSYPIPHMDECIDSLGDAAIFTSLDANSGYWPIEMDETDKDKTNFTSHCR